MKTTSYRYRLTLIVTTFLILLAACSPQTATTLIEQANDPAATDTTNTEVMIENSSQPVFYAAPAVSTATDLQSKLIRLYQQANPAVVYVINSNGTSGSGFVYDKQGHIVTNQHVVSGARSLEIVFAGGERMQAEIVGSDTDSDLAVIQVSGLPQGVTPLALASTDSIMVGQFVVAIGNPYGEQGSMSLGIISGLGRTLPSQRVLSTGSTYTLPEVIQTDAPINPGNSGGPLLNLDGEVVGVTSAIASETGSNSGVGFAIPVQALELIIPDLIASGEHSYAYMGVSYDDEITLEEQAIYNLAQTSGAYLISVATGSPAHKAGLVAANPNTGRDGDLIIAIDGQPIDSYTDLNRFLVFNATPGQKIELTVLSNGAEKTVTLTLGRRP